MLPPRTGRLHNRWLPEFGASLEEVYGPKLVPRADTSLFAVSQHGLGAVNLFDITAHAGKVTVIETLPVTLIEGAYAVYLCRGG